MNSLAVSGSGSGIGDADSANAPPVGAGDGVGNAGGGSSSAQPLSNSEQARTAMSRRRTAMTSLPENGYVVRRYVNRLAAPRRPPPMLTCGYHPPDEPCESVTVEGFDHGDSSSREWGGVAASHCVAVVFDRAVARRAASVTVAPSSNGTIRSTKRASSPSKPQAKCVFCVSLTAAQRCHSESRRD